MKILAFSGFHGNRTLIDIFVDSIIGKRLNPDIFVCAGDIGDSIIVELFTKLSRFKRPVLFVLGNHTILDSNPKEIIKAEKIPNVFHLSDHTFSLDNFVFVGQDAWTHFTSHKRIEKRRYRDLTDKFAQLSKKEVVLVTHHGPLGIFDKAISYPKQSWKDNEGYLHGGSFSIRQIVEKFQPSIHIFAHLHSDGGKWELFDDTLFVNVCHLGRETREGKMGVNGSYMVIGTDMRNCIPHHLSKNSPQTCACGAVHFLNYRKCFNCYRQGKEIIDFPEIKSIIELYRFKN